MGESFIYSYRLTFFGGTAPCCEGDRLSLAICKRDMRRVIGRKFLESRKYNDEFWFIGVVGHITGDNEEYFKSRKNDILYIAKVTNVKEYFEYFTDDNRRSDCIYKAVQGASDFISGGKNFVHKGLPGLAHSDRWLQERDWDIHSRYPKYVLISDEFCFINKEESDLILQKVNGRKWARGVGHSWFKDEDYVLTNILKELVSRHRTDRNIPNELKMITSSKKCGNKKEAAI